MGKYTSDHNITVRDRSGSITNQYTAKDQIDPVKTGSAALGPLIAVALVAFLFLSVLPILMYALYIWHFSTTSRALGKALEQAPNSDEPEILIQHGFKSRETLIRSSKFKLWIWIIFGGLATAAFEYVIFTGDLKTFTRFFEIYGVSNVNESNILNKVFTVYETIWPVVIGLPISFAVLFTQNELCELRLTNRTPNKWLNAATLPHRVIYFITVRPVVKLIQAVFSKTIYILAIISFAGIFTGLYYFSSAKSETEQYNVETISGTFSAFGNDRKLILREVPADLENYGMDINAYYGGIEWLSVPLYHINSLLDDFSGTTHYIQEWLLSDNKSHSVLTELIKDFNYTNDSTKDFMFRVKLYQELGGNLNQTDSLGLKAWVYTSTFKGYTASQKLGIQFSQQELHVVYNKIKERESEKNLNRFAKVLHEIENQVKSD